jgi:hypothetical protein
VDEQKGVKPKRKKNLDARKLRNRRRQRPQAYLRTIILRNNQESKKKNRGLDRLEAKDAGIGGAGSWEGITAAEG